MRRAFTAAGSPLLAAWFPWLRAALVLLLAWSATNLAASPRLLGVLFSQERNPTLDELSPTAPPAVPDLGTTATASEPNKIIKHRTFLDSIRAGGYIGVIIILLSIAAVGFVIEHALTIRKQRLMPPAVVDQLEDLIAQGDIPAAIKVCEDPRNYSLVSEVVLAGLERFQSSEFGFADYKAAVEEAGEDFTAKLYRKTDALNVIGVIAPMLGLFGTVEGMMEAFNIVASSEGMARPHELADSISKALVTTWLGLIVAIPAMLAFSFFRNKIDSLVSECGKRVEHILLPLSRRR
jgi:biopolymer transport protein ExbB